MIGSARSKAGGAVPGTLLPGHPKRLGHQPSRVLDLLGRSPGLNIDELSAHLGLRRTAINHHLRILLRIGAVVRIRQGRHALHFRMETPAEERMALSLLRIPGVLAFSLDAFARPEGDCAARAMRLGISPRHARRALRLLERNGMARTDPRVRGTTPVVHLHPQMRVVLARMPHATRAVGGGPLGDLP